MDWCSPGEVKDSEVSEESSVGPDHMSQRTIYECCPELEIEVSY